MSLELFFDKVDNEEPQRAQQQQNEPTEPLKRCSKCGEHKPYDSFCKKKSLPDGHSRWCRPCDKAQKDNRAGKEPALVAFQHKRARAKSKGIEFSLDEALWLHRMKHTTHCPDCAGKIFWHKSSGTGTGSKDSGSFDRIDPKIGYREGNVRITCSHCNQRKNDSPVDEWVALLEKRIEKGIIEEVDPRLTEYLICE